MLLDMVGENGKPSLIVGLAISSTALGSILFSPFIGQLSHKIGPWTLIVTCLIITGFLLIPQAYSTTTLEFIFLRFLMGLTLAGLIPTITKIVGDNASSEYSGTLLDWLISVKYLGHILGPLSGGAIARYFDISTVFITTVLIIIATGIMNLFFINRRIR
ncbi:MFS transporter [Candidatus Symbiopectobacterium endolongispinus]|uniref:MFS transporter n=1 Tax=Candidatus Symbiopectobacterium endolongispinus TaxID=2812664 RepID=UPI0025BC3D4C|nr:MULTISPECIES: MFS transporter [Symbiopectobacterium]